jgi:hypothetical protein
MQIVEEENKRECDRILPTVSQLVSAELDAQCPLDELIRSQLARDLGEFMLGKGFLKSRKALSTLANSTIEYVVWFDGFVRRKGEEQ